MKKRILSCLMALAMVIGMLPATALAADTEIDFGTCSGNTSQVRGYTADIYVTAAASDGSALSYQWYKKVDGNFIAITGATESVYTVPANPNAISGTTTYYRCDVTAGTTTESSNIVSVVDKIPATAAVSVDWKKISTLTVGSALPTVSDAVTLSSAVGVSEEISYEWSVMVTETLRAAMKDAFKKIEGAPTDEELEAMLPPVSTWMPMEILEQLGINAVVEAGGSYALSAIVEAADNTYRFPKNGAGLTVRPAAEAIIAERDANSEVTVQLCSGTVEEINAAIEGNSAYDGTIQNISSWLTRNGNTFTVTPASGATYFLEVVKQSSQYGYVIADMANNLMKKVGKDIALSEADLEKYSYSSYPQNSYDPFVNTMRTEAYEFTLEEPSLIILMQIDPSLEYNGGYAVLGAYAAVKYYDVSAVDLELDWNMMPSMSVGGAFPSSRLDPSPVICDDVNAPNTPKTYTQLEIKLTADNVRSLLDSGALGYIDPDGTKTGEQLIEALEDVFGEDELEWITSLDIPINPAYTLRAGDVFRLNTTVSYLSSDRHNFVAGVAVTLDDAPIAVTRYEEEDDDTDETVCCSLSFTKELGTLEEIALNLPTRYAITVEESDAGEIVLVYGAVGTEAAAGSVVYMEPDLNDGYAFAGINVYKTGDENTTIEVDQDDDLFTFVMPAYPVTVELVATVAEAATIADLSGWVSIDGTTLTITPTEGSKYICDYIPEEYVEMLNGLKGKPVTKDASDIEGPNAFPKESVEQLRSDRLEIDITQLLSNTLYITSVDTSTVIQDNGYQYHPVTGVHAFTIPGEGGDTGEDEAPYFTVTAETNNSVPFGEVGLEIEGMFLASEEGWPMEFKFELKNGSNWNAVTDADDIICSLMGAMSLETEYVGGGSVLFGNVKGGTYTFRVKAHNEAGKLLATSNEFTITVTASDEIKLKVDWNKVPEMTDEEGNLSNLSECDAVQIVGGYDVFVQCDWAVKLTRAHVNAGYISEDEYSTMLENAQGWTLVSDLLEHSAYELNSTDEYGFAIMMGFIGEGSPNTFVGYNFSCEGAEIGTTLISRFEPAAAVMLSVGTLSDMEDAKEEADSMRPQAPSALNVKNETVKGKADGSISGLTSAMEYRTDGSDWTDAPTGGKLENLAPGTYYVRYKAAAGNPASRVREIVIAESTKTLTVTYNLNGASGTIDPNTALSYNAKVTAPDPAPTRAGYVFEGWYRTASGSGKWDFANDTVTEDMTLYAKWTQIIYSVSGMVNDHTGSALPGATVQLMKNGVQQGTDATTDATGNYSFSEVPAGTYNIVVTKDDVTMTVLVTVTEDTDVETVAMPDGKKISTVDNTNAGKFDAMVGGLNEIANDYTLSGSESKVEIKLTVTEKADSQVDAGEKTAIENAAGEKELDFVDLTLTKQIDGNAAVDIGDNNDQLLTIIIPFNTYNRSDFKVFRYHGSEVHTLTTTPDEDTKEHIVVGEDTITLYAMKFSTYAIGYTEGAEDNDNNGGTGGIYIPAYPVTGPDTENGKVTISSKYPVGGSTVKVTVTPDEGYELDTLKVTDSKGNEIALTDNGDGTYTFKMPYGSVTVNATFRKIACAKDATCPISSFTDASPTACYHDGVHYCVENELIKGLPGNLFDPNGATTRAQFVTILWRLAGEPVVNYAMDFGDVAEGIWCTEAIRWAASEDIVDGYGDGTFRPSNAITREQMSAILYRYVQSNGGGFTGSWMFLLDYEDRSSIADWAYEAVCWVTMNGIVEGKPGNLLDPKGTATRAQVATILWRFCENVK